MMTWRLSLLALLTIATIGTTHAATQQLRNDPPSYFGGGHHDSYLDWLSANDIQTAYKNSVFLPSSDPTKGAAVHWYITGDYFHVAVAARASGWVGFGFSEVGGMHGSDMALFTAVSPNEVIDAHVVDILQPKPDDCQQDWILVNSSVVSIPIASIAKRSSAGNNDTTTTTPTTTPTLINEEFLMFQAKRLLQTNDPQDIALTLNDSSVEIPEQRIIAAWGDTPEVTPHGPTDRARGAIRVHQQFANDNNQVSFEETIAQQADGSFYVGANDYTVPSDETTYIQFCVSKEDLIQQGVPNDSNNATTLSIVGFRPIIDDGPSGHMVHHFVVNGYYGGQDCQEVVSYDMAGYDMVYVWAPGDGPFVLPDFLGGNLLGDDGFHGFSIQIHYNNPQHIKQAIDNSGALIYYSNTKRPVEMGVIRIADPFVAMADTLLGDGYSAHTFDCPSSCSEDFLDEPVTIVREYLHMHGKGARMTNEQVRRGKVMHTAAVEVWDFAQYGNVPVRQAPYQFYPGDSFRTTCYYNTPKDSGTIFGPQSQDEMCMMFIYYYPRKTKPIAEMDNYELPWRMCAPGFMLEEGTCNAQYSSQQLDDTSGIHRAFGTLNEQCNK